MICWFSAVAPKCRQFGWPQLAPQQNLPCLAASSSTSQWRDAGSALEVGGQPRAVPAAPLTGVSSFFPQCPPVHECRFRRRRVHFHGDGCQNRDSKSVLWTKRRSSGACSGALGFPRQPVAPTLQRTSIKSAGRGAQIFCALPRGCSEQETCRSEVLPAWRTTELPPHLVAKHKAVPLYIGSVWPRAGHGGGHVHERDGTQAQPPTSA